MFSSSIFNHSNFLNRERQINAEDGATAEAAIQLEVYRKPRELALKQDQAYYTNERRKERTRIWLDTLSSHEKEQFSYLENLWINQKYITVHSEDLNLRKEFEKHVLLDGNEEFINARQWLEQVCERIC